MSTDEISGTVITYGLRPPGADRWSAMMRERAGLGLITHLTVHELQRPQTRPAPARSSTCARTRRCCSGWRQQP